MNTNFGATIISHPVGARFAARPAEDDVTQGQIGWDGGRQRVSRSQHFGDGAVEVRQARYQPPQAKHDLTPATVMSQGLGWNEMTRLGHGSPVAATQQSIDEHQQDYLMFNSADDTDVATDYDSDEEMVEFEDVL